MFKRGDNRFCEIGHVCLVVRYISEPIDDWTKTTVQGAGARKSKCGSLGTKYRQTPQHFQNNARTCAIKKRHPECLSLILCVFLAWTTLRQLRLRVYSSAIRWQNRLYRLPVEETNYHWKTGHCVFNAGGICWKFSCRSLRLVRPCRQNYSKHIKTLTAPWWSCTTFPLGMQRKQAV